MRRIKNQVITGLAALLLLFSCDIPALMEAPEYAEPEAIITIYSDSLEGLAGRYDQSESVAFDGSSSAEGDEAITLYTWDFGDGSQAVEGIAPSYSYDLPGSYQVTLTVTDALNHIDTDTRTIVINTPPVAIISTGDVTVTAGESTTLQAQGSNDPDGNLESYVWNSGDGTVITGSPGADGTIPSFAHTYGTVGSYTASLTVSDDDGTTHSAEITVTVDSLPNVLPAAEAGADQSLDYNTDGSVVTVDGSGSSDSDGTILSYAWTFSSLPADSILTDDSITDLGGGRASFDVSGESAAAAQGGSLHYELTLTITDNDGGTATDTVLIAMTGTGSVVIGIQ